MLLTSFPTFPNLPPELRLRVWELSLSHPRIIRVRLRNRLLMDGLLARQPPYPLPSSSDSPDDSHQLSTSSPSSASSAPPELDPPTRPPSRASERYGAVVDGYQTLSKLFRVSREARSAAQSFYRVHLPCWLIRGATLRHSSSETMHPGTLYFNPDHDFLHITNDTGQVADFLHDLRTVHDPRGVGLLNLAVDGNGLTGPGGLCGIASSLATLPPELRDSFVATLTQLREVFFLQIQHTGRHVLGYRSGAPTADNLLNLSFPILPVGPSFNRLPRDPRAAAAHDLAQVFINLDPREMLHAWRRLFHDIFGSGVVAPPQTEYRVLLAFAPPQSCAVYDRRDAEEWLRREEQMWLTETMGWAENGMGRGEETAFGFWLFPVEAFGELPKAVGDSLRREPPRVLDLRGSPPELGVVSLS
ncbi:hypothetical protein B0T19DRAFT_420609 [Cercophora scortea]|uniref:2EXR domain-containing protein n=1 Tax=Cercophora scortea TaxID=314031 RepID=A0AAE0MCS9_9PEZI|nr:hypothetical protein B0T19DRAFT_420609 [Cercophora scortea]